MEQFLMIMSLPILELPTEIIQLILHHACLSRGLQRGLRLKLVCSTLPLTHYL